LKSADFWLLHNIPVSLLQHCHTHDSSLWSEMVREKFSDVELAKILLQVFEEPHDKFVPYWNRNCLGRAIYANLDEIISFLAGKEVNSTEPAICAAVKGRLDILKLLHKHGHPWERTACEMAAREGHLDCLMYLHEHGCPWSTYVHYHTSARGHFACMKYAYEQGLRWPRDALKCWDDTLCVRIVQGKNIEMLNYALEHGVWATPEALIIAVAGQQLDFVIALLDEGCEFTDFTTWYACDTGRLDILQLLHEEEAPWDASATWVAAEKGYVDVLTYLHENGCPWDEKTTRRAVRAGQLDTLRYALEHGCPFDDEIIEYAVECVSENGLKCLHYLVEVARFYEEDSCPTLMMAFKIGNYKALQYLLEQDGSYPYYLALDDTLFDEQVQWEMCASMKNKRNIDYDANLLKCIQCGELNEWEMVAEGSDFSRFVCENASYLPLCASFYRA